MIPIGFFSKDLSIVYEFDFDTGKWMERKKISNDIHLYEHGMDGVDTKEYNEIKEFQLKVYIGQVINKVNKRNQSHFICIIYKENGDMSVILEKQIEKQNDAITKKFKNKQFCYQIFDIKLRLFHADKINLLSDVYIVLPNCCVGVHGVKNDSLKNDLWTRLRTTKVIISTANTTKSFPKVDFINLVSFSFPSNRINKRKLEIDESYQDVRQKISKTNKVRSISSGNNNKVKVNLKPNLSISFDKSVSFLLKQVIDPDDYDFKELLSNIKSVDAIYLAQSIQMIENTIKDTLQLTNKNDESHVQIMGALGNEMFRLITWSLENPIANPKISFRFNEKFSTLDIDQVCLKLSNTVANISMKANECKSNEEFLQDIYKEIKANVYTENKTTYLSNEIVLLDKSKFFASLVQLKGGHTLMSSSERKKYFLLYSKIGQDVFKISISAREKKNKKIYYSNNVQIDKNKWFSSIEVSLIDDYIKLSLMDRIWLSARLVILFLNKHDGTKQGFLKSQQFSEKHIENITLMAVGGEFVYVLICIQMSILENIYNTNNEINYCFETYGGKSRQTVNIDLNNDFNDHDYDKFVDSLLVNQPMSWAPKLIAKYSTFFGKYFEMESYTLNELVWGVGVSYDIQDTNNKSFLFGSIPSPIILSNLQLNNRNIKKKRNLI